MITKILLTKRGKLRDGAKLPVIHSSPILPPVLLTPLTSSCLCIFTDEERNGAEDFKIEMNFLIGGSRRMKIFSLNKLPNK